MNVDAVVFIIVVIVIIMALASFVSVLRFVWDFFRGIWRVVASVFRFIFRRRGRYWY